MNFLRRSLISASRAIIPKRGLEEFIDKSIFEGRKYKDAGRAWKIQEIRRKSFDDLEKLWFVLFKERNRLVTARRLMKTMGLHRPSIARNLHKVKKSMARIKRTIAERNIAAKKMALEEFEKKKAAGVYKWPPEESEKIIQERLQKRAEKRQRRLEKMEAKKKNNEATISTAAE